MEIKNAETKLDQADSFLTKLKQLLKKHWGILTIIGIGYFFYWAFTTDFEELPEENNVPIEQVEQFEEPEFIEAPVKGKKKKKKQQTQQQEASYYITNKTYMIDDYGYRKGDTVYIDEYSDGVIEKYYTDHENYVDDYPTNQ